ncbi:hypothetical protein LCGC14_0772420 [marine sediment metagenome]|uniref:Uncharacterized protein n=1 Tax=marine sediment metagenome TaxID=412755 RepID=A0A0F9QHR8_9ZZZZ
MYCPNCHRPIPDNPGDISCIGCGYDPADPDQVADRDEALDHARRNERLMS